MQRGWRRHPCPRDPRRRLRRLPLGQHRRAGHSRPDRPPVRGARGAAVRARRRRSTCSSRSTAGSRKARSSRMRSRRSRASFDVGTIAVRSDLAYERFDLVNPRALWQLLTQPVPPGLQAPRVFGDAVAEPAATVPARSRRAGAAHAGRPSRTHRRSRCSTSTTRSRSSTPRRPRSRSCSTATVKGSSTRSAPGSSTATSSSWSSRP